MNNDLQKALVSLVSTVEYVVVVLAVIAIWKWLDI